MKLHIPTDCGNAPKKLIITDLNIAFASADIPALAAFFHQDISWDMVGDEVIEGHDEIINFLTKMNAQPAVALRLDTVITHGKYAAARGSIDYGNHQVIFHDFYEFSSAGSDKVKKIISIAISEPLK